MAIPDFQSVMLPLIKVMGDGQERNMREVTDLLAESFHLTEREREELLPSGQQSLFNNRVGWAKSHLKAAGLLENPVRGRVRISDLGRQVLAEKPPAINVKFLKRFPAYCDFIGKSVPTHDEGVTGEATPVEERPNPSGTYRRCLQITTAGNRRGSSLKAQSLLPAVLRVSGCQIAHGDGLRRRCWTGNSHGQVG